MNFKLKIAGLFLLPGLLLVGAPAKDKAAKANGGAAAGAPVDLNSASESALDSLPGVGPATAKKIIAGRPYSGVSDLSRAGLKPAVIQKLTPLVTVGAAPQAQSAPPPVMGSKKSQKAAAKAAAASAGNGPMATSAPQPSGGSTNSRSPTRSPDHRFASK